MSVNKLETNYLKSLVLQTITMWNEVKLTSDRHFNCSVVPSLTISSNSPSSVAWYDGWKTTSQSRSVNGPTVPAAGRIENAVPRSSTIGFQTNSAGWLRRLNSVTTPRIAVSAGRPGCVPRINSLVDISSFADTTSAKMVTWLL